MYVYIFKNYLRGKADINLPLSSWVPDERDKFGEVRWLEDRLEEEYIWEKKGV